MATNGIPEISRTISGVIFFSPATLAQKNSDKQLTYQLPALCPTEVLVRVAAAGIDNTDMNTRIGRYSKVVKPRTKSDSDSTNTSGAR